MLSCLCFAVVERAISDRSLAHVLHEVVVVTAAIEQGPLHCQQQAVVAVEICWIVFAGLSPFLPWQTKSR